MKWVLIKSESTEDSSEVVLYADVGYGEETYTYGAAMIGDPPTPTPVPEPETPEPETEEPEDEEEEEEDEEESGTAKGAVSLASLAALATILYQ